ncbi:MAG TPA: ParB/RepB/Spo0J family partition protein [Coprothermobacter sp.]|nr:ParB/RepB/Spo0J family partition protein [Coprothermobacter sp.]
MSKNKLGKGLNALLGDNLLGEEILQLDPGLITTSPFQPRSVLDDEDIDDLAESLKKTGVLQPILVRGSGDKYELIAGERRWRAAIKAGLEKVPVIVKNVSDEQAMVMALVENLQRKDLNPVEVARACKQIIESTGMTQEELAEVLGMSRSNFANLLRLLDLPQEVQTLLQKGDITVGHAKVLLSLKSEEQIVKLAKVVAQKKLSVRELEQLCRASQRDGVSSTTKKDTDPNVKKLKQAFAQIKTIPVRVSKSKNGYSVTISFSNPEKAAQLAELIKQWETIQ